jgi:hypothetical protein
VRKPGICVIVALSLTSALTACGSSSDSGTTSTTLPTATSSTATPASRAAPTTTTVSGPMTATAVATKMISSGVPATIGFTYTAENDPNKLLGRQGGYESKVSLQDNRLPKVEDFLSESASSIDGGGSIECYAASGGARARYQQLQGYSGTVLGDGYDYVSGPCVLRLSKDMTPTQANQYQQAFETATK